MSADPLEHKVPRHVPGEQYEKAYDLANRRGKQVIELRQKLDAAEAALAESRGEVERLKERQHERTEVFGECISDYERLRGYVNRRYGDTLTQREVNLWMGENGYGLFVEGVPESDAWRDRYWRDLLQDAGTDESHA